jgi:alpha-tubulin suppressor-like RCC1 family protein
LGGLPLTLLWVGCGARTGAEHELAEAGRDASAPRLRDAAHAPDGDGRRDPSDPFADEPLPPTFPPTEPPAPTVTTIAAGYAHTCAVAETGIVYCWGDNEGESLGFDSGGDDVPTPTAVPGVTNAFGVSVGTRHGCALHSDGRVACWGANNAAQLGHGPAAGAGRSNPSRPAGLVLELPPVVETCAGGGFSCGRTEDGQLLTWGGAIADDAPGRILFTPTPYPDLDRIVHVNAGAQHACAIDGEGRVTCWGESHQGTFGMSSRYDSRAAVPVPELTGAVQLAGDAVNCALLGDGTVSCCPLTDGEIIVAESCDRVPYLTGAVHIAASAAHVCAIILDGTVWCWGQDNNGTVSVKTEGIYVPRPVWVRGVEDAVEIAAGSAHVCAKQRDRQVLCWGKNDEGQLGIGVTDDETHPTTRVPLEL